MLKHYYRSKYFLLLIKTILVLILLISIYNFKLSIFKYTNIVHHTSAGDDNVIVYAKLINYEEFSESDSSSNVSKKDEKSDLFYYILGIIILIAAGFILKQRYGQYLKQRDSFYL